MGDALWYFRGWSQIFSAWRDAPFRLRWWFRRPRQSFCWWVRAYRRLLLHLALPGLSFLVFLWSCLEIWFLFPSGVQQLWFSVWYQQHCYDFCERLRRHRWRKCYPTSRVRFGKFWFFLSFQGMTFSKKPPLLRKIGRSRTGRFRLEHCWLQTGRFIRCSLQGM